MNNDQSFMSKFKIQCPCGRNHETTKRQIICKCSEKESRVLVIEWPAEELEIKKRAA